MRSLLLLPPLLLLGGCNVFDFLSPTSVQGLLLGVEASDGETSLGNGPVLGAVYLAEATSIQDFASNLISDGAVSLDDGSEEARLDVESPGLWVTGEEAITSLVWTPGESLDLTLVRGGDAFTATVTAPIGPTPSGIPRFVQVDELPEDWSTLTPQEIEDLITQQAAQAEFHTARQPITVDLSADDYEYWIVVVVDQDGEVTYDNRPEGAQGYIDWVLEADPVDTITIPGDAFPERNAAYAVGVAGVVFAETKAYDGFNWLISNLGAGTLTVAPVITGDGGAR